MSDIHLVTTGSYSGYMIEAAFTDRNDAQRLVDRMNRHSRDARVETHTLHPAGDDTLLYRELWAVTISINPDGVIADDAKSVHHTTDFRPPVDTNIARIGKNHTYRSVTAHAATEEAALKAARERAAQVAVEMITHQVIPE